MKLDPGIDAYLAEVARLSGPGPAAPGMNDRRLRMETLAAAMPTRHAPELTLQNWFLPVDGREIPLRIYRPTSPGPKPLTLYFHGGGWVMGSIDTHDYLAAAVAREADSVVVSVHYRRSPENRHPAALEDCCAALHWAVANAGFLNADTSRLAVAGDSAGGHLATLTALRMRDAGGPRLAYQLLIYPMVEPAFDRESMVRYADAPGLTRADAMIFWESLLGGAPADASAVPSRQELSGMPPAYVVTAEFDPLRDEGESYARALLAAGVPVQMRRAPALIHGFMRAAPFSAAVRKERELMFGQLHSALHCGV